LSTPQFIVVRRIRADYQLPSRVAARRTPWGTMQRTHEASMRKMTSSEIFLTNHHKIGYTYKSLFAEKKRQQHKNAAVQA